MEGRETAVFRHMRVILTEKRLAYGALVRADRRREEDDIRTNEKARRAGKERDREKEGRDCEDRGRVGVGGDDAPPWYFVDQIRAPQ